jgi:hypothetical protein
MGIAKIKNDFLRRTMIVLVMPVFLFIAAGFGASAYVLDLLEYAASVWRKSQPR